MIIRHEEIPPELRLDGPLECREALLDGRMEPWPGPLEEAFSPLLQEGPQGSCPVRLGATPQHDAQAGLDALDAAERAYARGAGTWPSLPLEWRAACVERFARLLADRRQEIVRLLCWEICKSLPEAEMEFERTQENLRETLAEARGMDAGASRTVREGGLVARERRSPLGVALCLGPYNFPLNEALATLIPALLLGNTAVLKAPRLGRMLFVPLMDCLRQAFPPGVVNVLFGNAGAVEAVMASGRVDVFACIGSSRSAEALRSLHPRPNRLRSVLGLEAKNAAIILPDADLDLAVSEVLLGAFGFNGQRCTAIKLVFAHRSVAQEFAERLAQAADGLRMGPPWQHGVHITPLPEPGRPNFLEELARDALAHGARPLTRRGVDTCGSLRAPAVFFPVSQQMRLFHEEQFGPLCPVVPFADTEEVLAAIADSDYGQQSSVFGQDAAQLASLTARLERLVARVNLNCKCQRGPDSLPFTGRRDSAEGIMSVPEALRAFSLPTLLAARATPQASELLREVLAQEAGAPAAPGKPKKREQSQDARGSSSQLVV